MARVIMAAGLISLTVLAAWSAEDYAARAARFQKLHAERRQLLQDYCVNERKMTLVECTMQLSKEGHCQGQGMPETKWLSETCQWNGT